MSDTILGLLRDLNKELRAAGDRDLARMVQQAIAADVATRAAFLRSNELWGGAGSVADQAAAVKGREVARKVEAALIRLGEEQLRMGVLNPRTAAWIAAFSEWKSKGI